MNKPGESMELFLPSLKSNIKSDPTFYNNMNFVANTTSFYNDLNLKLNKNSVKQ